MANTAIVSNIKQQIFNHLLNTLRTTTNKAVPIQPPIINNNYVRKLIATLQSRAEPGF